MLKLIATGTALTIFVLLPISNACATITTDTPGTLTTIYGTGNPNTWGSVTTYSGTDGNFQLALNSHINPNNGNQNVDFSVNVDPAGLGVTLGTAPYSYILTANNSAAQLNLALGGDNQYGTSATGNGQGLITTFTLGAPGNTIFQNSESMQIWDFLFGVTSNPTSFTLEVEQGGAVIASDTLAVAPVPEPTTIFAGAMLLLPIGISTLRMARRKRTD
jgi:hypothetical protein